MKLDKQKLINELISLNPEYSLNNFDLEIYKKGLSMMFERLHDEYNDVIKDLESENDEYQDTITDLEDDIKGLEKEISNNEYDIDELKNQYPVIIGDEINYSYLIDQLKETLKNNSCTTVTEHLKQL